MIWFEKKVKVTRREREREWRMWMDGVWWWWLFLEHSCSCWM